MISLKSVIILFFVLVCTLLSGAAKEELYHTDNKEDILLQYFKLLKYLSENFTDKGCDTGECAKAKCNCCPGYAYFNPWIGKTGCYKCNCGKTFGCEFQVTGKVICRCPTGYSAISTSCKADCETNPCKNYGKCIVKGDSIVCSCTENFTGEFCENNKCSKLKCLNKGQCIIKEGKASCNCTERYTGNFCQTDKCSELKCLNKGQCIIREGKPFCNCTERYTGNLCQTDKCSELKCLNKGQCIIREGNPFCNCTERYTGNLCQTDKCSELKCLNKGQCIIREGKPFCNCTERYTGNWCQTDMCDDVNCQNGGTCIIKDGEASCECADGYGGKNCERHMCDDVNCQNGGTCIIKDGEASCECAVGYLGNNCEKHFCDDVNCQNGGTCIIKNGEASCECADGYGGKNCERHMCDDVNCQNGGTCIMKDGEASCECAVGYLGNNCEKHTCDDVACQNGGTCKIKDGKPFCECVDGYLGNNCEKQCKCKNGKCSEISGKIICICYPEFGEYTTGECVACNCGKGANCSFESRKVIGGKFKTCICPEGFKAKNWQCVDMCDDVNCQNGGTCIIKDGEASCECAEGYLGNNCEKHLCDELNCQNAGTCIIKNGEASCECADGYGGKNCERHMCDDEYCQNAGTCIIKDGEASCECAVGYLGNNCEIHLCNDVNCQNGGTCIIKDGEASCECADRYGGKNCERHMCDDVNCQNGGTCIIKDGEASCECTVGYLGNNCEKHLCDDVNCQNGGTCIIKDGEASCECADGYGGKNCERHMCTVKNCQNGGTCYIEKGEAVCICPDTHTGETCEKQCNCTNGVCTEISGTINCICYPEYGVYAEGDCRACNCGKGANCSFSGGSFWDMFNKTKTCICPKGFQEADGRCVVEEEICRRKKHLCIETGGFCRPKTTEIQCICPFDTVYVENSGCQDVCTVKNCQNGGTCYIEKGKAVCICPDTHTGETCEKQCNCTNGVCTEISGRINCICYPEYGEYAKGDCRACNCGKGANCSFSGGSFWGMFNKTKTCMCPKGFQEADGRCVDPDIYNPCHNEPCKNGAHCEKNGVQPMCICPPRYSGKFCEKDMCSIKNCQNGGTCFIEKEKAVCICPDTHTGETCEKQCNCTNGVCTEISGKINCICYPEYGEYAKGDCRACNCGKGANCSFSGGSFWGMFNKTKTCICPKGFQEADGRCVDPDIYNPCHNKPCKNGAHCEKNGVQPMCICPPRYSGKFCEKDMCSIKNCQNGGTCYIEKEKAICICPDTHTGETCEKQCNCTNGICTEISGKINCICYPEYGEYAKGDCRACNCGKGANCSFSGGSFWGMFNKTKTCICPKGFQEADGRCVVEEEICRRKKHLCIETGGFCRSKTTEIQCICPFDTVYVENSGCQVSITDVITKPEDRTTKTSTEITTDLEIDDDILKPTENFKDVTSNETLTTRRQIIPDTTEAVKITSSTSPIDETKPTTDTTTTTTSVSKWMEIALITLSCIVVLLIMFSSYMAYRYKNNH